MKTRIIDKHTFYLLKKMIINQCLTDYDTVINNMIIFEDIEYVAEQIVVETYYVDL